MIEESERFNRIASSHGFRVTSAKLKYFNNHACDIVFIDESQDMSKLLVIYDLDENTVLYYPELYCFYNSITDDYEIRIGPTSVNVQEPSEEKLDEIFTKVSKNYHTVHKEVRLKRILAI